MEKEKTEKTEKKELTDLQKRVVGVVAEKLNLSPQVIDLEKIKLHKVSTDDFYCVIYNYCGIGIHIPQKEVDEQEYLNNGINIWHTYDCQL